MKKYFQLILTCLGVMSLAVLTGCQSQPSNSQPQPTSNGKVEEKKEAPSVQIVSPTAGATVEGTQVEVKLDVKNHQLVDFKQAQPKEGEGHVHVWLDTDPTDPKAAVKVFTNDPVVFKDVKLGEHKLVVQLVDSSHQPLKGSESQQITFTTK